MTSRTDIQQHFGRVQADSIKLPGAPAPMGEWVLTKAGINSGNALGSNPVNELRYTVIGKTCIATYLLGQAGGAGTASGNLELFLPIRAKSLLTINGHGSINSNTSGVGIVTSQGNSADSFLLLATTNAAGPSVVSATVFGLAANTAWTLFFTVTYEIA